MKFLDRITSSTDCESVLLQGPDEQYQSWGDVEAHYTDENSNSKQEQMPQYEKTHIKPEETTNSSTKTSESAGGALSQMLLSKLNFAKGPAPGSPMSTPPTSPSSSVPQSSKTSPEVKSATMADHDASPTPPALKPLINSVVWYTYEKRYASGAGALFLTNAGETASLVRNFGISPKNIHQLRSLIALEEQEAKNQDKYQKKHPTPPSTTVVEPEPKPLFKYEDGDSDEEEVVFKPRGRGNRGVISARGSPTTPVLRKTSVPRSPVPTFEAPALAGKPQLPIEEIDPDSFDRGSFGRGSVPLVNTSNHVNGPFQGFPRGPSNRSSFAPAGPSRGGFYRGTSRGFDRGSSRGRRLFVP